VYPVFTAVDADEANELTSTYSAQGHIVYQGASTFTGLGIGTANQVLKVNSGATAPEWGQVATAGIADSAVTSAKIADGTIVAGDVAAAFKKLVCPVGTITAYGGSSAPSGWLLCNGDAIDAAYTELIALVGANTPDMKGRFPLGDNSTLTLLGAGGSNTISSSNMPSHTHSFSATSGGMSANSSLSHSITDSGHTHNINGQATANENSINGYDTIDVQSDYLNVSATEATSSSTTGISIAAHTVSHTHDVSGTTGSTGSGTDYWQPHLVVNFIIKHDY
jgi:microcystin-dependent protein